MSGTMIAAHATGIPVFVTGGIGGVHRDAQSSNYFFLVLLKITTFSAYFLPYTDFANNNSKFFRDFCVLIFLFYK